jgi:prophage regulatory protein
MPTTMSAKPRAITASTPSPSIGTTPAKFLRLPSVLERVPYSRPSLYRLVREGKFPRPIRLGGGKAVAWLESDVDAYMNARIQASRESAPPPDTDQVA